MNAIGSAPEFALGWAEANQRMLMQAVRRVSDLLRKHEADPSAKPQAEPSFDDEAAGSALQAITAAFALSAFERDILLMCVAPELDPGAHRSPCFGLALAALPGAHWTALLPTAPLRLWRLLEAGPGRLVEAPLHADEWILHALAGVGFRDDRVSARAHDVAVPAALPPSHQAAADAVARLARSGPVQLCGTLAAGIEDVAATAAAALGCSLATAHAAQLDDAWIRLWGREALLGGQMLLLDCTGLAGPEAMRTLARLLRRAATPVVLSNPAPLDLPIPRVELQHPLPSEQSALFRAALGLPADHPAPRLEKVVAHFDLGPAAIRTAAVAAGSEDRLWDACRSQARAGFDHGTRITPTAVWEDLVLPPSQDATLRELLAEVRHRRTVHDKWGFGTRVRRSRGVTALLHGPSGTGKTLAAEVLAAELGLDLLVIDLSALVSKYIGETEQNLRRAFDAAEASGAVLLFDEADALFGRRSEVRDSHDRYANMEVSYLLQRMESYRGLAVLTTNVRDAVDTAFLRRLRFIVEFPYPGPAERERMWRRAIPPGAPTADIAYPHLAQVNLAGGHIRNIALAAAFLAAEEGAPIGMAHMLHAARRECAKLERPLTRAEIAGWA